MAEGSSTADNTVLILTDQQRADTIGCYGNDVVDTPNIDALAADGARFDRAYTPTAICSPARASLLTGQRPFRHNCIANAGRRWGDRDDLSTEPNYPTLLEQAGYDSAVFGKWHLNEDPGDFGLGGQEYPGWAPPFDHEDYREYLDERGLPRFNREELADTFPKEGDRVIGGLDDRPPEASFTYFIAERAIERIEAFSGDESFHLAVHFFGPHNPYFLPREYYEMYDPGDVELPESAVRETFENKPRVHRTQYEQSGLGDLPTREWRQLIATYWGFVTFIDDQVGRILDALEDNGLADNTGVVYTSDHGAFATSHKMHDKGPVMHEDIYNVPLVARNIGVEGVRDEFVSLLDFPPTILDLAGIDPPETFDGRSLTESGADDWRKDVLAEFHGHVFPYTQRMLRTDRYKLVVNPGDTDELYDLDDDQHELTNRIDDAEYADVQSRLVDRLYERLDTAGDADFPPRQMRK